MATITSSVAAPPVRVVGSWQVGDLIGEGSWTRVYRARPHSAAASEGVYDYALKAVHPQARDSELAACMLFREAEVCRRVQHPHLVAVLDAQLRAREPFLVMPYLGEATAGQMLEWGHRPRVCQALWLVRQVAEACVALHAAGWLHGDVKPANIVVSSGGHATLLDLGLARRLDSPECHEDQWWGGTLAYAAPESLGDAPRREPRSDVYSLGVTLFELLTGRRPFPDGEDLAYRQRVTPPPHVSEFWSDAPEDVAALVSGLLSKRPEARPAAAELVEELVRLEIEHLDYGHRAP